MHLNTFYNTSTSIRRVLPRQFVSQHCSVLFNLTTSTTRQQSLASLIVPV